MKRYLMVTAGNRKGSLRGGLPGVDRLRYTIYVTVSEAMLS